MKKVFALLVVCMGLGFSITSAGREIVVISTADSGEGTLRWALEAARPGDVITFDPRVFPPASPASIYVRDGLPPLQCGRLTIDASNAGVILDGSGLPDGTNDGLYVISDGNVIRGLQIIGFPANGITLAEGVSNNTIGGDRSIGTGPVGQGNVISGNENRGIVLSDNASFNTIAGNSIGTDASGTKAWGNGLDGIHMRNAGHNQIVANMICSNGGPGLDLYLPLCSGNSIAGNSIGVGRGGSAFLGNRADGIAIHDGPQQNVIGPDNIVANNAGSGVMIGSADSMSNTITKTRIYSNSGMGIDLREGANASVASPRVLEFDVGAGTVIGAACANCMIEIFSDAADEGEFYEGQTSADASGLFTFATGVPFAGAHVTATATNEEGNTGAFSAPTTGPSRVVSLQVGDGSLPTLLRTLLERKASSELADNRIGTMFPLLDSDGLSGAKWIVETLDSVGFMWNKYYIAPPDWQEVGSLGDYSSFQVTRPQDAVVDGLRDRGISTLLGIVYWPDGIHEAIAHAGWSFSRFRTDDEISDYLDYVRFLVDHFAGRVETYEILNEPDAGGMEPPEGRGQYVRVEDYVRLVRRVVPVIREEDPNGRIAVAGVSRDKAGLQFLFTVLDSGISPLVDVITWNPHFGPRPGDPSYSEYYYGYPALVRRIKDAAWAQGFEGEFMATVLVYRTPFNPQPFGTEPWEHTPMQAAKYFARGIVLHLGLDVGVGPSAELFWQITPVITTIANLCTALAGHEAIDLAVSIDIDYAPTAYCAFRYPNGDRMLAVWTDSDAQDDDPGVPATVTFPGLVAQTVTGIDVLSGFEQELISETDGANTIVRDVLVKDYPILIKLSGLTLGGTYRETVGDGFHRVGESACSGFRISKVDWRKGCITLTNKTATPLGLLGWTISDGEGSYTFAASVTVAPGATYSVCPEVYNPGRSKKGLYLDDADQDVTLYAPEICGGMKESTKKR